MNLGTRTVLAIDPGTAKIGMALVRRGPNGPLELLWRAITPVDALNDRVRDALALAPFTMAIVGSGTNSRAVIDALRAAHPAIGILVVDERDTTMQARERYWEHNPRRGWRRLLPSTLQTPPEPVDDFVALILAERVLNE
jgi:RNase H-fold protein (predicted Holliday junction resolvase)